MIAFLSKLHEAEIVRRFNPVYNRKFFFAVFVLVAGTYLCMNGKMDAATWSYFALGLAGIYIGGNVSQKFFESRGTGDVVKKEDKPNG